MFQILEVCCLASQAIAEVNKQVEQVLTEGSKRGPYTKYSAAICAEIGKYACQQFTDTA